MNSLTLSKSPLNFSGANLVPGLGIVRTEVTRFGGTDAIFGIKLVGLGNCKTDGIMGFWNENEELSKWIGSEFKLLEFSRDEDMHELVELLSGESAIHRYHLLW